MSSTLILLITVLLLPHGNSLPSINCSSTHYQCRYHHRTQICVVDPALASEGDNNISTPQIQRKRRRRKADSFFLSSSLSTNDDNLSRVSTTPHQEAIEESRQKCPFAFATTFARYRVDLSHNKSANNPESEKRRSRRVKKGIINKLVNNIANKDGDGKVRPSKQAGDEKNPWGVISGIAQVFQSDSTDDTNNNSQNNKIRKKLETKYSKEVEEGTFRFVSTADEVESSLLVDEDFFAAAAFWRMASDITEQKQNTKEWYLALPETTPSVASNLCDILNWYSDLGTEEDSFMQLSTQLDSRSDVPVPVIKFTAIVDRQQQQQQQQQRPTDPLPSGLDTERRTKAWVTRLLVELGVCPFTKSSQKSGQGLGDLGVPVANIMYRHSEALVGGGGMYLLMADAWEAISDMVAAGASGKKGVSSILLSAPGFDDDFPLWAGPVFAMLEAGVSAIQAEEMIGVVCFHPKYIIPDGKSWPGFGHMHSLPRLKNWYKQYSSGLAEQTNALEDDEIAAGGAFQRRTPHAVINVLRAEQLEAAEGRRSTGELYERNIRVLMGKEGVGLEKLMNDLELEQQL